MQYQIRDIAVRQYLDRVDADATYDEAVAALLAAVQYAKGPPSHRADGTRRLRASSSPERWSRGYLIVGSTGDVIGVQPEHERRGGAVLPEAQRREPTRREPTRRELERYLHERALVAGAAQAGENRRHPDAKIVAASPPRKPRRGH